MARRFPAIFSSNDFGRAINTRIMLPLFGKVKMFEISKCIIIFHYDLILFKGN